MTDNEVAEIERIWELEASRNPTFYDNRKESDSIEELGMKRYLEKILRNLKSVILLRNNDLKRDIRGELTESVATKKIQFSDCLLLFNPSMGLILRQI